LRQVLEEEGVSTRYLAPVDAATTLSLICLDEQGIPHNSFYGQFKWVFVFEVVH